MLQSLLQGIGELEEIIEFGDYGFHWVADLQHEMVTHWIRSAEAGEPVDDAHRLVADGYLRGAAEAFEHNRLFYETYHRVLSDNELLWDILRHGVNDWQSGYRWVAPSAGLESWSQSMFDAVDSIIGAPFRFQAEPVAQAIQVIRELGASEQSIEATEFLRTYAGKYLYD